MSQDTNKPRTADNESRAFVKHLRTSPRKLNLVAATIRGKSAEKALVDLQFSHRRIAKDVQKVLKAAVTNAENNHNLDVDRLVVAEASVGKTMSLKRFHARGRGKASRVEKPFSSLTIVVRELAVGETAKKVKPAAKKAAAKAKKSPETAPAAKATKTAKKG